MDPRDINFQMRSGIGSGHQPVDPNDALTLMAVSSVFMEKAYGDAARYARAMNHPEILGEDIVLALKFQLAYLTISCNHQSNGARRRVARAASPHDGYGGERGGGGCAHDSELVEIGAAEQSFSGARERGRHSGTCRSYARGRVALAPVAAAG